MAQTQHNAPDWNAIVAAGGPTTAAAVGALVCCIVDVARFAGVDGFGGSKKLERSSDDARYYAKAMFDAAIAEIQAARRRSTPVDERPFLQPWIFERLSRAPTASEQIAAAALAVLDACKALQDFSTLLELATEGCSFDAVPRYHYWMLEAAERAERLARVALFRRRRGESPTLAAYRMKYGDLEASRLDADIRRGAV